MKEIIFSLLTVALLSAGCTYVDQYHIQICNSSGCGMWYSSSDIIENNNGCITVYQNKDWTGQKQFCGDMTISIAP